MVVVNFVEGLQNGFDGLNNCGDMILFLAWTSSLSTTSVLCNRLASRVSTSLTKQLVLEQCRTSGSVTSLCATAVVILSQVSMIISEILAGNEDMMRMFCCQPGSLAADLLSRCCRPNWQYPSKIMTVQEHNLCLFYSRCHPLSSFRDSSTNTCQHRGEGVYVLLPIGVLSARSAWRTLSYRMPIPCKNHDGARPQLGELHRGRSVRFDRSQKIFNGPLVLYLLGRNFPCWYPYRTKLLLRHAS